MSSIDRDALILDMREAAGLQLWRAGFAVDAILPAVEQAIRAAEQRGPGTGSAGDRGARPPDAARVSRAADDPQLAGAAIMAQLRSPAGPWWIDRRGADVNCACQEKGWETLGYEPCGFHAEKARRYAERECEQLRTLLRAVRLEANPKDYYVGYIGQMIDDSGLLGSGDKGQA